MLPTDVIWMRKPGGPAISVLRSAVRHALSNGYEECSPPPAPTRVPTAPIGVEGAAKKGEPISIEIKVPVAVAGARAQRPHDIGVYGAEAIETGFIAARATGKRKPYRFTDETRNLLAFYRKHPGSNPKHAAEVLGADPSWCFRHSMELAGLKYLERVKATA